MKLTTLNVCAHLIEREIDDMMSFMSFMSTEKKEKIRTMIPQLNESLREIRQHIQQKEKEEMIRLYKKKVEILEDTVELLEGQL